MRCPIESRETAELVEYSVRSLQPERTAVLARHVESCSACSEFVAGQRAVWLALDAWKAPAISADFDRELFRRIEQEPQTGWWDRWLGPLLLRPALPIAAAACLVVAVGLGLRWPVAVPVPQPQSVQVENLQPEQVEHALDDLEMLSDFTRPARTDAGEI